MEDTHVDIETLITLVQERPIIWDKSLEVYKSRNETVTAWREVCSQLNTQFETLSDQEKNKYGKYLSQKWANVRDRYTKYLKKLNEEKTTGSKAKSIKKYVYSEQLSFLQKNIEQRETVSSFQDEDEPADTDETTDTPIIQSSSSPKGKKRKARHVIDIEQTILEKLNEKDDRHVSFFKAILPTIQTFSDTETIEFQSQVLNIVQNIHKTREIKNTQPWPVMLQGTNAPQPSSYGNPEQPVRRHVSSRTTPAYRMNYHSNIPLQSPARFQSVIPEWSRPGSSSSSGSESRHTVKTSTPTTQEGECTQQRLRRRRSKSRKYGIITHQENDGDMEMEPLGDGDDEDDDYTVFEMDGRKK